MTKWLTRLHGVPKFSTSIVTSLIFSCFKTLKPVSTHLSILRRVCSLFLRSTKVHFNQAWSERRKDLLDDFNDSSIKYFQIYQSFGISSSSINGLQALFLSQINNSKFFLPFCQKEGSNEILSQTWSRSGTSENSSIVVCPPLLSLQDLRGIWYEDQIDQSGLVYTLFRS